MKYLCLIYDDEKKAVTMSKADLDALMSDYFAEGPATFQRHYTEILDQRVEARCGLNMCPLNRCAVLKRLPLANNTSLHMAFHIVTGSPAICSGAAACSWPAWRCSAPPRSPAASPPRAWCWY